jgi:hypothetical protein
MVGYMSEFWDRHYQVFADEAPSNFAIWAAKEFLSDQDEVVEIGSGNGRDGIYLSKFVGTFTGIDLSDSAVEVANQRLHLNNPHNVTAKFQKMDFSEYEFLNESAKRLVVYSRFSLHSDDEAAEDSLLSHLSGIKNRKLLVLIEVRTIYDELYGVGESVGNNGFVTDHYRRFIDPDLFRKKVEKKFRVNYFEVSDTFAPYKNEKPKVLRIAFKNVQTG